VIDASTHWDVDDVEFGKSSHSAGNGLADGTAKSPELRLEVPPHHHIMRRDKRWEITKSLARIHRDHNMKAKHFFNKVRNAVWGFKNKEIRIATRINSEGQTVVSNNKAELFEIVEDTWCEYFSAKPTHPALQPHG
jgi:hypothetical protein